MVVPYTMKLVKPGGFEMDVKGVWYGVNVYDDLIEFKEET